MTCEGTPVKAPPASGRKIMSPTPQQSLQSSIEAMQLQTEVEDQESGSCERLTVTQEEESIRKAQEVVNEVNQKWTAVYLTIAKRMLKHLDDSEALKVSTREIEGRSSVFK